LSLPVTDWVLRESKVVKPKQTVKFITDSTFDGFRYSCCMSLRDLGYDVRLWYCKRGAWEEQIATKIFTSERTDLCIASPNGNRLALQEDVKHLGFLRKMANFSAARLRVQHRWL
jgi:hypothetical protein